MPFGHSRGIFDQGDPLVGSWVKGRRRNRRYTTSSFGADGLLRLETLPQESPLRFWPLAVVLVALAVALALFLGTCVSRPTAAEEGGVLQGDAAGGQAGGPVQEGQGSRPGQADASGQPTAPALEGQPPAIAPPARLAGSTEVVGDDGVVRGTSPDGVSYLLWGRGAGTWEEGVVSLVAAGDQIGTDYALELADAWAGETGDDAYDFRPYYRDIRHNIQQRDLRYVNQETMMCGAVRPDYVGWPSFNTPDAAAEAIVDAGFNLVNVASNHTLDYNVKGAEANLDVWKRYPQVATAGSYRSPEDRATVRLVERGGLVFSFLGYAYGDNYFQTDLPDDYHLCGFDKEAIAADVARAKKVSDAVIVSMHWGTEYQEEPNAQQVEYAQFLADLDVDLVLGSHAHVVQPIEWVKGAETDNYVPVVYGLSDIVSSYPRTENILSGLFTCKFSRNEQGTVDVGDLCWYPAIEWSDGTEPVRVRLIKDMTEEEVNANTCTPDVEDDYAHITAAVESLGMQANVIM